jgi:hypothetical protein
VLSITFVGTEAVHQNNEVHFCLNTPILSTKTLSPTTQYINTSVEFTNTSAMDISYCWIPFPSNNRLLDSVATMNREQQRSPPRATRGGPNSGPSRATDEPPAYSSTRPPPPFQHSDSYKGPYYSQPYDDTINLKHGSHKIIGCQLMSCEEKPIDYNQVWLSYFCEKVPRDRKFKNEIEGFSINTRKERCMGCRDLLFATVEDCKEADKITSKYREIVDERERKKRGIGGKER